MTTAGAAFTLHIATTKTFLLRPFGFSKTMRESNGTGRDCLLGFRGRLIVYYDLGYSIFASQWRFSGHVLVAFVRFLILPFIKSRSSIILSSFIDPVVHSYDILFISLSSIYSLGYSFGF
jgi:hypothetical protein